MTYPICLNPIKLVFNVRHMLNYVRITLSISSSNLASKHLSNGRTSHCDPRVPDDEIHVDHVINTLSRCLDQLCVEHNHS